MSRSCLLLVGLVLLACAPSEPVFRAAATARAQTREVPAEPAAAAPRREPRAQPVRQVAPPAPPERAVLGEPSREGWNDAQIDWLPHDAALQQARSRGVPVCVVMHAGWCAHCRNYAHVFEDARIVERARRMLMVRVDTDAEPAVAAAYAVDGGYVPRTYFVAPDGSVMDIDAHRARFRYFFDEQDPASLLAAMDAALAHVL